MHSKKTLQISDLESKKDLYTNFSNISYQEKKQEINKIIVKVRGCTLDEAKNKKLLRRKEVKEFLEEFGIELAN